MKRSESEKGSPSSQTGHRWWRQLYVAMIATMVGSALVVPTARGARPVLEAARVPTVSTRSALLSHDRPLPVSFEANRGQVDHRVAFLAHGPGFTLFITSSGAVLSMDASPARRSRLSGLPGTKPGETGVFGRPQGPHASRERVVRLSFPGSNQHPQIAGLQKLPGIVNYFLGNNPHRWHTGIPTFARVTVRNVYPGIDLLYHSAGGHLEYDWLVRPGANPHLIRLRVAGSGPLKVDRQGNLRMAAGLQQTRPVVSQVVRGTRHLVTAQFRLLGPHEVGLALGRYDQHQALLVDPQLLYSTYLGGSNDDSGYGIALDSSGDAYVTGSTYSSNFPTTAGAFQTTWGGRRDAFVTKLNPSGTSGPPAPIGGSVGGPATAGGGSPSVPHVGDSQPCVGKPVNCSTGNFWHTFTDLAIPGRGIPLAFSHTYNTQSAATDSPLGYGWATTVGMSLTQDATTGAATVHEEGGSAVTFNLANGSYSPAAPRIVATLVKNADGSFTFTREAQFTYTFDASGQLTLERDLNGYATTFGYNSSGQVTTVTDPAGRSLTIAWTGSHITGVTDPIGRSVTFSYDGSGNLAGATDVNGGVTHFTYDSAHRLLTMTDPRGTVVQNVYDSQSRVTSQTLDPAGLNRITTWSYNGDNASAAGGTTTVTSPRGTVSFEQYQYGELTALTKGYGTPSAATWTYTYDPATLGTTSVTDPNGHVTKSTYDSRGNVLTVTDALNRTTTFSYNALNNPTFTTDPLGLVTAMTYDGRGNLLTVTKNDQTAPTVARVARLTMHRWGAQLSFHWRMAETAGIVGFNLFAGKHRLNPQPIRPHHAASYRYRALWSGHGPYALQVLLANGRHSTVPVSPGEGTGTQGRFHSLAVTATSSATTTYAYGDSAHPGDVTAMTDPNGHTWTYSYDANGDRTSSTDGLGDKSTSIYNAIGWLTSATSPEGYVAPHSPAAYTTTFAYNPFGEITSSTDPLGHVTSTAYDADGNRISINDPKGNLTTSLYDAAGDVTRSTRPDGTTLGTTYNADGAVASQIDGKGNATTYAYDSLGRVISVTDPLNRATTSTYDGAGNRLTLTDPQGQTTTYGYDAANQRTSITFSDGKTPNVTNLQYDADGQRLAMTDGTGTSTWSYDGLNRLVSSTDGSGNTVGYAYDPAGNLTSLTYPGGGTVTRSYDAADRVQRITDWLGNSTNFGYDANGNPTTQTLPAGTGITDSYSYDQANLLTGIADTKGGAPLAGFSYARDGDNLLTSQSATGVGQPSESYGYSKLNQLQSVNSASYGYDAADNLMHLASGATLSYDNANQLNALTQGTSSTTFADDQRGNRTGMTPSTGSPTAYSYDQANRLVTYTRGTTSAGYAYNGDGLRMSKTVNGVAEPFVWDVAGGIPLVLKDGSTGYVYGPGGLPLEQINSSGTVLWYHHDQLGSTRVLTDASGTIAATYTYDAYGNVTAKTGTVSNPFGYAGEYTDAESGMQYLRARYYDPGVGQFLSRDLLLPMTRSPYAYVEGNPLNSLDPTGLGDCPGGEKIPFTDMCLSGPSQWGNNLHHNLSDPHPGAFISFVRGVSPVVSLTRHVTEWTTGRDQFSAPDLISDLVGFVPGSGVFEFARGVGGLREAAAGAESGNAFLRSFWSTVERNRAQQLRSDAIRFATVHTINNVAGMADPCNEVPGWVDWVWGAISP